MGLSASAVFHAGALTFLVLLPALGKAPLPEARRADNEVFTMPVVLQARVAPPTAPPRVTRSLPARPAARAFLVPIADSVPPVPEPDPDTIDDPTTTAPPCQGCVSGSGTSGSHEGDPSGGGPGGDGGPGSPSAAPIRVGSGVEAPRKLVHVAPRYPELARLTGLEGTVGLECVIDPAGVVAAIRVASGPKLLQEAAREAVRQWRYTPTKLNGIPVSIVMTVTVRFSLRRGI